MFPNYCNAMGFVGWILTLLVWSGMVALVMWGITRLFPGPRPDPRPGLPASAHTWTTPRPGGVDPVPTDPVSVGVPESLTHLARH